MNKSLNAVSMGSSPSGLAVVVVTSTSLTGQGLIIWQGVYICPILRSSLLSLQFIKGSESIRSGQLLNIRTRVVTNEKTSCRHKDATLQWKEVRREREKERKKERETQVTLFPLHFAVMDEGDFTGPRWQTTPPSGGVAILNGVNFRWLHPLPAIAIHLTTDNFSYVIDSYESYKHKHALTRECLGVPT
ncbi:hypothetical protein RUM43_007372 [Polyplax serrata]|uniref:Uncharacterized protein n=1 Tax=Polyplax serrata TaxID=468196 RepID=A0AAN8PMH8_POLSC